MKEGFFAVYKPKGPSSFWVVAQVRKIVGRDKKVGHAGTLDPLAEGVLVIAIGRESTKKISEEVAKEKEYIAEVFLGEESSTDDGEGERTEINKTIKPTEENVRSVLEKFKGEIMQKPPIFSAIKVAGKNSYLLARRGQQPDLKERPVLIKEIELLSYEYPIAKIRVVTGPGVYIRSLARDIGRGLKTGAYMYSLVRTRVGTFTADDAIRVDNLESFLK
jgi:tRNA pseudouridine55 synthase